MRRTDGLCPMCGVSPRHLKRPYCAPCSNTRRRELKRGIRARVGPRTDLGRRFDVLRMMCDGKQTKHIARALQISPRTVKHYIEWLRQRSKARTAAQLGVWAVRNGHVLLEAVSNEEYVEALHA